MVGTEGEYYIQLNNNSNNNNTNIFRDEYGYTNPHTTVTSHFSDVDSLGNVNFVLFLHIKWSNYSKPRFYYSIRTLRTVYLGHRQVSPLVFCLITLLSFCFVFFSKILFNFFFNEEFIIHK